MKKTILTITISALFPAVAFASPSHLPEVDLPNNGIELHVDRPQPADPDFGIQVPVHLPGDEPSLPEVDNTPERPHPDTSPDRPEPADPDFGVAVPEQPPIDNSPERPQPDFGDTPDWGVPAIGVGDLEVAFNELAQEMNERFDEQSEQIHGIRAGLHAVTNARPFVTTGEFAMGAGVGFSGSKEAVALGGAYGLSDRVSISGTFHYESSGKHSSSEVAGGVGVQFKFN
ncbi:YadA C-terminal domain-containing protein [Vibrio nigripulchritudo]|uniref:YadA C-terminal domain-containing protein n=1 Tax=Vibrio nigripulchritudo TaxID=28173 RepID=UPI0003B1F35A|nr:YadA C-terminal domain-containing protein [Vibrio nigripulchritudo]CCN69247.1 conserved hypothetical protein [Vibrio nigripulchritudo SFn118]